MAAMEVDDTLAYLTGSWTLERAIDDHRAGTTGSFEGDGEVRAAGRRGRYEEHGQFRLGSYHASAHRALDLVGDDDGGVALHFLDGRPFIDLNLAHGTWRAMHQCSPDLYELEFEVGSSDLLVERWRVTGPAKDYEARTTWRRR